MEWSNEDVLMFISVNGNRPVLWDLFLPEYKESNRRHDGFQEIATHFNTDKNEIEKKLGIC